MSLALLNPSSPFSSKQGSCTSGDVIQPALFCPLHCPASCLVSPRVWLFSVIQLPCTTCRCMLCTFHWLMCSHLVSNTVHPCNPLSVYHACYCFLMDKKENSFHMNIILNLPVNFNNKCFYQKMDSDWQAKGTCITNLKNFMSHVSSRVQLIQRSTT